MSFGLLAALNVAAQQTTKTKSPVKIEVNSSEYSRLKAEGQLGKYQVVDSSVGGPAEHTTVYPAGHGTEGRTIDCGCWVEPDDTYAIANFPSSPLVDDGSSNVIPLPFTFSLYGNTYNQMYINTNGNVTFAGAFGTYSSTGFPLNGTPMVAPFWADVDLSCAACGAVRYKVTEDAVYINWMEVGYFPDQADKKNTFQVVLTNGNNSFLGPGKNVAFCYKDMQWTTGSASGGSGGFGGTPATVGANKGTGANPQPFIQMGRFGLNNGNYDGPFGNTDGINWLDNKSFVVNIQDANNNNVPPIVSGLDVCDTLKLCINETYAFNLQFISPEQGQVTNLVFDNGGMQGLNNVNITNGNVATFTSQIVASAANVGLNTLTFTATDNGVPAGITQISVVIEITDVEVPPISITGPNQICGGQAATLTASPGFDQYVWSNGMTGQSVNVSNATNNLTVTGYIGGCNNTSAPVSLTVTTVFFPPVTIAQQPICSNSSTLVTCPNLTYQSYEWSNYLSYPGTIYSTNGNTAMMSAGTFMLTVVNSAGCPGQYIFDIDFADAVIPPDTWSDTYCDNEVLDFCCGYATAQTGNFWLYLFNSGANAWNGASVSVYLNGDPVTTPNLINYTPTGPIATPNFQVVYGDVIEIFYNSVPGGGGALSILNCTNNGAQLQSVPLSQGLVWSGAAACSFTQAFGSWDVTGPGNPTFSTTSQFNTTFTPDGPGVYNLHYNSSTCNIDYYYEMVYSQPLELDVLQESPILNCSNTPVLLELATTDVVGDGVLTWSDGSTEDTFLVTQDGNYCVTFENDCSSLEECVDVTIQPTPTPLLTDQTNCNNGTVLLNPIANESSTYTYAWTGPGVAGSSSPEVTASQSGTYSVSVSNACGTQSATSDVIIELTPTASISNTLICNMQPYAMDPVSPNDPSFTYLWTGPGINPTAAENTASVSGTYTVTISNNCGQASSSADVIIEQTPTATLNDYTNCDGVPYSMDPVTPNNQTFNYEWTGPGVNAAAAENTATQSGTYTVTISNNCGSVTADANVVIANPLTVSVNNISSCDEPSGVLTATANQGTVTYSWSNGGTTQDITVSEPGSYTVTVNNGCESIQATGNVVLNFSPSITLQYNGAQAPGSLLICPATPEQFQVVVTGTSPSITWTDDCSLNPPVSDEEFFSVNSEDFPENCITGEVTLTATATNACGTSSVSVELIFDPCITEFINVYSPNGDGINDVFTIPGLDKWVDKGLTLRVFNRWGQIVFESEQFDNQWKGGDVPGGTYYYMLTFPNGVVHTSPLTIMR